MKKIALSVVTFLLSSIFVMGEATPIYEYRNEALKKIDAQMDKERDRQRLKNLNAQFEDLRFITGASLNKVCPLLIVAVDLFPNRSSPIRAI